MLFEGLFFFVCGCLGLLPLKTFALSYEGDFCSMGGPLRNYGGVCQQLTSCPSALSQLRAGISPPICATVEGRTLICCQTELSISLKKCLEYERIARGNEDSYRPIPLLPSSSGGNSRTTPPPSVPQDPTPYPLLFIVGGTEARVGQFPHLVALGYDTGGSKTSWLCGGSLISEEFVLTAAHCLKQRRGRLVTALLGDVKLEEDLSNPVESRALIPISSFILHPNYKEGSKQFDIGLVKLDKRVEFGPGLKPGCLPQPKDRNENLAKLQAQGWGLTEFGGNLAEILQFVQLGRISTSKCREEYPEEGITASQFCALGEDNKDTCEGDSGGGIGVTTSQGLHTILGVTSFGSKYCGAGKSGVYTNVQSFVQWIEDNVWPMNNN